MIGTCARACRSSLMRRVRWSSGSTFYASTPGAMGKTAEDVVNNILYDTGPTQGDAKYNMCVLVDNEPGILSRVSGLLSARGFNIDSLTVTSTDVHDVSRMTVVLTGNETQMEQAKKQLDDLVNVWAVIDYTNKNSLSTETLLLKVSTFPPGDHGGPTESGAAPVYEDMMNSHFHRQAIIELTKAFEGTIVDLGTQHMIVQLTSWPRRVDAFIKIMRPYGIIEVARSGAVTMLRSPVTGQQQDEEAQSPLQEQDVSALPPS